jgi:hypothetical protein
MEKAGGTVKVLAPPRSGRRAKGKNKQRPWKLRVAISRKAAQRPKADAKADLAEVMAAIRRVKVRFI